MSRDLDRRIAAKMLVFVAAAFACAGAIVCLRAALMWRAQAWGEFGLSVGLVALAWGLAGLLFRLSLRVESGPNADEIESRLAAAQRRLASSPGSAAPDELEAQDPEVAALLFEQADLDYRATARRRRVRWVTGLFFFLLAMLAAGALWVLVRVATR